MGRGETQFPSPILGTEFPTGSKPPEEVRLGGANPRRRAGWEEGRLGGGEVGETSGGWELGDGKSLPISLEAPWGSVGGNRVPNRVRGGNLRKRLGGGELLGRWEGSSRKRTPNCGGGWGDANSPTNGREGKGDKVQKISNSSAEEQTAVNRRGVGSIPTWGDCNLSSGAEV